MHPTYAFFVFALVLVCADVCSGQEVKHLTGASPGNTKKRSVVTQEKGSKSRRLKSSKSGSSGSKTKSSQSKSGKSGKGSGKEDTSDDVIDCGADTLTCALGPNLRFTLYVESDADNLDLTVLPPVGERLSFSNDKDEASSGIYMVGYGPVDEAGIFDFIVINIGFPLADALAGNYEIVVTTALGAEVPWYLTATLDGEVVGAVTGLIPADQESSEPNIFTLEAS
ncbi:predicted protein [Phaeodactylum tricornutum CCAP 1055/1]|uniref:Uncharacterized protein n=1 Tax=Phaeodactylum tricornutum (strain CCAP 1055/1) TaxID=556484 RepID=B7GA27_PHATC|nr:predicted protein [Phaeodactylum tricornutum CCAP 1055/1]EEC44543.1 predicted protein [Phaeodactylum tricornutum CCAP 1055/1]|eukprot:XP_002183874.1 predicted protein [Phaeodactylum tricornutum CCAP 1055/1]